jgi:hypothetical protein
MKQMNIDSIPQYLYRGSAREAALVSYMKRGRRRHPESQSVYGGLWWPPCTPACTHDLKFCNLAMREALHDAQSQVTYTSKYYFEVLEFDEGEKRYIV